MKLTAILDAEDLERHLAIARKQIYGTFRKSCPSRPVFILGKQRSGTSMMMRSFHRHPETLVYDEHRNSIAFLDHRLRSFDTVRQLLNRAKYPLVCFKPICDSHLIRELHTTFPEGHFIWAYRHYKDVANSSLRKFEHATRAIRLVCTGQPGAGWFGEGLSSEVAEELRSLYEAETLSDFDLACLVWWARNQIMLDSGLAGRPSVTLVKYETLVTNPKSMLRWLHYRIDLGYLDAVSRNITPRSIDRHPAPALNPRVEELCEASMASLDEAFRMGNPPHAA